MFKYNWCRKKKRIPPPLVSNQVPFYKKKKKNLLDKHFETIVLVIQLDDLNRNTYRELKEISKSIYEQNENIYKREKL